MMLTMKKAGIYQLAFVKFLLRKQSPNLDTAETQNNLDRCQLYKFRLFMVVTGEKGPIQICDTNAMLQKILCDVQSVLFKEK
jgi:hypothetical protein